MIDPCRRFVPVAKNFALGMRIEVVFRFLSHTFTSRKRLMRTVSQIYAVPRNPGR